MPLYQHTTSDERVRTVPGSAEDARLSGDDAWQLVEPPPDLTKRNTPDVLQP